jgi:hypothetical protein
MIVLPREFVTVPAPAPSGVTVAEISRSRRVR